MGFIFQYHYLLPEFSALENVLMPAIKAGVAEKKRDEAIELLKANALNVMQIFQEVNRTNGCTILYVTHDAEFASMAHKQILLLDGQIESITTKSAGTRVQKKRLP
jgi:putative ABC transport system ATP-binding protein/lipoprotein-releasing system ATP-binding protein